MTKRGIDDLLPNEAGPCVSRCLDVALSLGRSHGLPALPWEDNPYLRDVLGSNSVSWLQPPTMLRTLNHVVPVENLGKPLTLPAKRAHIRSVVYERAQNFPDDSRMEILLKWSELLMLAPEKSSAGRMLLQCAHDEKMIVSTLQDLFRSKSASTLKIRVSSLSLFFSWILANDPAAPVLPVEKDVLYGYACWCRETGKSASRIDTLLASLRFASELLGFEGAMDSASSARVQGASYGMFVARAPRKRAEALSVAMLCWLEIAVFAMPDPFDRMLAGFCMMCAMGRLRCSDANRIRHAGLIGRYVEGALSKTKNSMTKEKASAFIPLVVPAFGLLGKPWFLQFIGARRDVGLLEIPTLASRSADEDFVLVPQHASLVYKLQRPSRRWKSPIE